MKTIELGEVQTKFAEIIWDNAPVPSGELVKICAEKLNWKKSTTYTVLRNLCSRGLFVNDNGIVKTVISREEFNAMKCETIIEERFNNSLPSFVAAFISNKGISKEDAEEIKRMIDEFRRDK